MEDEREHERCAGPLGSRLFASTPFELTQTPFELTQTPFALTQTPFALSLSKRFDRLSANGISIRTVLPLG